MKHNLGAIASREVFPGFHGRFVHSGTMTFAYWTIDPDARVPAHSHPHEQVVNVLKGRLELVVDSTPQMLEPGDIVAIPGNITHSARAVTACRVLDVFSPVREDYR